MKISASLKSLSIVFAIVSISITAVMLLMIYGVSIGKYQMGLILPIIVFGVFAFVFLMLTLVQRTLKLVRRTGEMMDQIAEGEHQFSVKKSGIRELDGLADRLKAMAISRHASDLQLYEREQNLAITLDSIDDGVMVTDTAGLVTRMNPTAERLTGWKSAEALGQDLDEVFCIVDEVRGGPVSNLCDAVIDNEQTVLVGTQCRLVSRDGSDCHISQSAAPIRDRDNRLMGVVLVFSDVGELYARREQETEYQRQLQSLFDSMQGFNCVTDILGSLKLVTTGLVQSLGLEVEDVVDQKIWELFSSQYGFEDSAHVEALCARAAGGEKIAEDLRFVFPDGTHWIAYSISPTWNQLGEIVELVHQGVDITERKRGEEQLLDALENLQLYRDQSPLANVEWNTDMRVTGWNSAATTLFGYTEQEAHDENFISGLVPEGSIEQVKALWEVLLAGDSTRSVVRTRGKDGSMIIAEWHSSALTDRHGVVIGAASRVVDITERQHAQEELIAQELEQRNILNSMSDAVLTFDDLGTILSCNSGAEQLFGYSVTEMLGQSMDMLLYDPDSASANELIKLYFAGDTGFSGSGRELAMRHKNRGLFLCRVSGRELPSGGADRARLVGVYHDLTELKEQEEQVRRAQKMDALGKLTGGIAHDFNNMLGVVMGYADLLIDKLPDEPKLEGYAKHIRHAGERGAQLTRRLLSFARAGETIAVKVDLNQLLEQQQDLLQKTLTVRISLRQELANHLWPVWLDTSDVEDALLNISINAMHAMESVDFGAELIIRTANQPLEQREAQRLGLTVGDYVLLSLTDNGSGMDETTREKIFDPFFSTKGEQGTGLGLSQVFGFLKRAGGGIKVHSEVGRGTRFELYLPRYIESVNDEQIDPEVSPVSHGGSETILVVDDEAGLRDVHSELLSAQGYKIVCAADGSEALEVLSEQPIDLMLSDVIMPGIDGYQLATIVEKNFPAVKIQLVSGFADELHVGASNEEFHAKLLHKPLDIVRLLGRIRELLDG